MKVLIVTVAGVSSRFSESIGVPTIKCLYHKKSIKECLLYRLLANSEMFDKYIIVGGYRHEELKRTLSEDFTEFMSKIEMVENPFFKEYGSGYSLYVGLQRAIEIGADDIVFAEGDLYLDRQSYKKVCESKKSVITINSDPILANKAVALFEDVNGGIHYIYDTGHSALFIEVPFLAIYNSGQVWRLANRKILLETYQEISEEEWRGTNLVFVEKYFRNLGRDGYEILRFKRWINCNTVFDYDEIEQDAIV